MKKVILGSVCLLAILSGCNQQSKDNCCTGQGKAVCTACCDKDSMEVVMDLHRKVKPECVAAFKESFAKCKESTVNEPGCIDYGVFQSPEDSTEFLIYEVWKNQSELDKHGQTPHLKQHVEETKDMFDSKSNKRIYVCKHAQE